MPIDISHNHPSLSDSAAFDLLTAAAATAQEIEIRPRASGCKTWRLTISEILESEWRCGDTAVPEATKGAPVTHCALVHHAGGMQALASWIDAIRELPYCFLIATQQRMALRAIDDRRGISPDTIGDGEAAAMTIRAKYGNGVFKPLEDAKLTEAAKVEVHVPEESVQKRPKSVRDWPIFGMWAGREDIPDGVTYEDRIRRPRY
jgi:AF2212-like protein